MHNGALRDIKAFSDLEIFLLVTIEQFISIKVSSNVTDPDPGAKKRSKMLNNHNIILLFIDFYNILSFKWFLLIRKSYDYKVILIYFRLC